MKAFQCDRCHEFNSGAVYGVVSYALTTTVPDNDDPDDMRTVDTHNRKELCRVCYSDVTRYLLKRPEKPVPKLADFDLKGS